MKRFLILLLLIFHTSLIFAQGNPFISKPDSRKTPAPAFSSSSPFLKTIASAQRTFREKLGEIMGRVKSDRSPLTLISILGLSLLYGLIHALGPGHRKTVIFSYFLSKDATPSQGFLAGFSLAFLHAASAVGIILVSYIIIKSALLSSFEQVNYYLEGFSYGALALIGLVMLGITLIQLFRKKELSKGSGDRQKNRSLPAIILAAGLVPCPGAATILLFSISLGIIPVGIFAVFAMSLGMAVIISGVAIVTIFGKKQLLVLLEGKDRISTFVHEGLEIVGNLLIFLFGLFMSIPFLFPGITGH